MLSASIVAATRRSFDGRPPSATGRQFADVSIHQVRAASVGARSQHSPAGAPSRATLAPEELTILASWEQAAAEALAFAPERLAAVTADAQAGAPWRAELGIRQPSMPLQHSISGICRPSARGRDHPSGAEPDRCGLGCASRLTAAVGAGRVVP